MQHQDIIVITAAGAGTWLRERLSPSAWVRMFGEGMIGGYKDKMEKLREVDDRIYDWLKDLKKLSKGMRDAAKAARYVDVAILLSQINRRLLDVKNVSQEVKNWTQKEILPFETEHQETLPSEKLFVDDEALMSEAGVFSDLKRKWVAKRLEDQVRGARKVAVKQLLIRTEKLVSEMQEKLSILSKSRASGDIANYIKTLNDISKMQTEFQVDFMPIYKTHLEPLVQHAFEEKKRAEEARQLEVAELEKKQKEEEEQKQRELDQELKKLKAKNQLLPPPASNQSVRRITGPGDLLIEPEENQATKPSAFIGPGQEVPQLPALNPSAFQSYQPTGTMEQIQHQPVVVEPSSVVQVSKTPKKKAPAKKKPETVKPEEKPAPEKMEEKPTTANNQLEDILLKVAHNNFILDLLKVAEGNDPYLVAGMLIRYAGQIEDADLPKSLELLAIAEGIIDG